MTMKKRRATSMLFAVATSGVAATAAVADAPREPAPMQPRVLATGAPACGNVSWKTIESPACRTARVILTSVIEQATEIGRHLAAFDVFDPVEKPAALTLAARGRPRS